MYFVLTGFRTYSPTADHSSRTQTKITEHIKISLRTISIKFFLVITTLYKQRMGDSRYQTQSLRLRRLRFTARTGTIELTLPSFLPIKPFGYEPVSQKTWTWRVISIIAKNKPHNHHKIYNESLLHPTSFRPRAVSYFSLQSYCTRNLSTSRAARNEGVNPRRKNKRPSFLVWSQSLIVIITSWFAIALDEIRTRQILREKADCMQSTPVCNLTFEVFTDVFTCFISNHRFQAIEFVDQPFPEKAWHLRINLSKSRRRQPKRTMFGFGLQRSFGRNILELLLYYLIPNKCKNLKDMKSSCLSICTSSL